MRSGAWGEGVQEGAQVRRQRRLQDELAVGLQRMWQFQTPRVQELAAEPLRARSPAVDDVAGNGLQGKAGNRAIALVVLGERDELAEGGAAEFAAQTFGEGNCDGAWFWHYESTRTSGVQVMDLPYHLYFPTVSRL